LRAVGDIAISIAILYIKVGARTIKVIVDIETGNVSKCICVSIVLVEVLGIHGGNLLEGRCLG
jgi:hypothetical protein